jgi:hypothetical protein
MLERLRDATLVIETHGTDVFECLRSRVGVTHDVDVIEPQPRTSADWTLPWYLYATEFFRHWAVQERRVMATPWIVASPRRTEITTAPRL